MYKIMTFYYEIGDINVFFRYFSRGSWDKK